MVPPCGPRGQHPSEGGGGNKQAVMLRCPHLRVGVVGLIGESAVRAVVDVLVGR